MLEYGLRVVLTFAPRAEHPHWARAERDGPAMAKPKRKLTAAEKAEKKRRRELYMTEKGRGQSLMQAL